MTPPLSLLMCLFLSVNRKHRQVSQIKTKQQLVCVFRLMMSHGAPPYTAVCPHPHLKLLLQAPPTQQAGLPPSQVRNARKLSPVVNSGWSQGLQSPPTALCDIIRHKFSLRLLHQSKMEHFQFADTKRQEPFCSHPAGGGVKMLLLFSSRCLSSGVKSPPSATSPVTSQTEESQDGPLTSDKQVKQKANFSQKQCNTLP